MAGLSLGVLGGPGTFSYQAEEIVRERHPELGPSSYPASLPELWAGLRDGTTDAILVQAETSAHGWAEAADELLSGLFVLATADIPFRCALLARPGTTLPDVRHVYGHNALRQCTRWLAATLPGVPADVHPENSVVAAREVAAGDGTTAVVSTLRTAELAGLVPIAADIDDGAAATWWVVGREPAFAPRPDTLVVTVRGVPAPVLAALPGWALARVHARPTGTALHEYDTVLILTGAGSLDAVRSALAAVPYARLAGATAE